MAELIGEEDAQQQALLLREFQKRLAYLLSNYRVFSAWQGSALSSNESLSLLRRAQGPRYRGAPKRERLAPALEVLINVKAKVLAERRGGDGAGLQPSDIRGAAKDVAVTQKPMRGRPSNELLRFHVHAFMALYRQTCGRDLCASTTRNSEYDPNLPAPWGAALPKLFSDIDPAATATAVVNIVLKAHASGAVAGKRFTDFFPFYSGHLDVAIGEPSAGPGYKLDYFQRLTPIYSS